MLRETSELYECKGCGGLVASTGGGCPYCGKMDAETLERNGLDGEMHEIETPWYRRIEIVPKKVQE